MFWCKVSVLLQCFPQGSWSTNVLLLVLHVLPYILCCNTSHPRMCLKTNCYHCITCSFFLFSTWSHPQSFFPISNFCYYQFICWPLIHSLVNHFSSHALFSISILNDIFTTCSLQCFFLSLPFSNFHLLAEIIL